MSTQVPQEVLELALRIAVCDRRIQGLQERLGLVKLITSILELKKELLQTLEEKAREFALSSELLEAALDEAARVLAARDAISERRFPASLRELEDLFLFFESVAELPPSIEGKKFVDEEATAAANDYLGRVQALSQYARRKDISQQQVFSALEILSGFDAQKVLAMLGPEGERAFLALRRALLDYTVQKYCPPWDEDARPWEGSPIRDAPYLSPAELAQKAHSAKSQQELFAALSGLLIIVEGDLTDALMKKHFTAEFKRQGGGRVAPASRWLRALAEIVV